MLTTVIADCAALTNWHEVMPTIIDDLGNRILASWNRHEEFLFRSNEQHLVLGNEAFILGDAFTDIDSPDVMVDILAEQQKSCGFIPNNISKTRSNARAWFEEMLCEHLRPYEQALQPVRTLRSDKYKYHLALIVTPAQQKALATSEELAELFSADDMFVVTSHDYHEDIDTHLQVIESALARYNSNPALTVVFCATKNTAQAAVRAGIDEVIGYANGWPGQNLLKLQLQTNGTKMVAHDAHALLSRMKALGGYTPPQSRRKWELSRLRLRASV